MSVGSTLTCVAGTWTGTPAPTITRQWLRGTTAIPGATALTYVVQAADAGFQISVLERATNSIGSITKNSNAISIP